MGLLLRDDKVYVMSFSIPRQNGNADDKEKANQEAEAGKAAGAQ